VERRRVFVLCRHLLFARALRTLIEQEEIEVVGVETDEPPAMESIKLLKPEILVVETGEEGVLLDDILPYLVRESPGSRIIGLSLSQNEVEVYYGHQRQVRNAEDLPQIISET
jgi:DNA-binding NarL/FixJ family response regulator